MTTLFILFFISLAGIIVMIGRKLSLVKNGKIIVEEEHSHSLALDVEKIKNFTYRNFRKYEHVALIIVVKLYVGSSDFLKNKYSDIKTKLKNRNRKTEINANGELVQSKEENIFLKKISEYKHRIRHIKHRIKKEEEKE